MDWTGALNSPSMFQDNNEVNVYGSLTLISNMSLTGPTNGYFYFRSTSIGKTITTAGKSCYFFNFSGVGGGWTFQDSVTLISSITHLFGTLNTNNQSVSCLNFSSNGTQTRTLTLGSSIITCSGNVTFTSTGLTVTANTATLRMTGNSKTFDGGSVTYNNVQIQGTPTTIIGSNTFNTFTIAAGKIVNLTPGTTQTITFLVCNGTVASPSTLQSVTTGSAATIALPAGRYFIRHTSIKDITITGATAVTSIAGTNVSGNTGITFVAKFEMGRIKNDGSFNWYNSTTGTVTKVSG